MANFSYRFSMYNINGETSSHCVQISIITIQIKKDQMNEIIKPPPSSALPCSLFFLCPLSLLPAEALNQGDTVDLDALMADLCSIEQELSTISKPSSASRGQNKAQQRAPGGRSASTKHAGTSGGGSSGGSPAE